MNWLTNFVKPKLKKLVKTKDVPDDLWTKCPQCQQMLFHKDLKRQLQVCSHCGCHLHLSPEERFALFFDDGQYETIQIPQVVEDPIDFKDLKKYADRLKTYRKATQADDALAVAYGKIKGKNVVMAVFNFAFAGGSMGAYVGEGLVSAVELAILQKAAFIAVPSSGGARMQEGMVSLMQMARTTIAINRLKEKGLPYIVVFANPTTGGVTASFAMLGHIHIAEPGAVIGFAGQRVIEQTIREKLPEGFQTAEYLLEHGMLDLVVKRLDLRAVLCSILDTLLSSPLTCKEEKITTPDEVLSRYIRDTYGHAQRPVNQS